MGGSATLSTGIAEAGIIAPCHPILTTSRGQHRSEATYRKGSKKHSKLPEPTTPDTTTNHMSIDHILTEADHTNDTPVEGTPS